MNTVQDHHDAPENKLLHFLLVEDDDDHAEIVLRTLQRNRVGNSFERVVDGAQALAYVRRQGHYAQAKRPDVVLLDLKLPKISGHEVLAAIKEDPDLCSIPVVVLTTSSAETDRARAYQHHANSYLVKPINFARFRQMVNDLSLYWGVWNQPADHHGAGCHQEDV
jgi:CheY-like chemotaxis protein